MASYDRPYVEQREDEIGHVEVLDEIGRWRSDTTWGVGSVSVSRWEETPSMMKPVLPFAVLPHQCGDWKIGGPNDCRQLAADLLAVADIMESAR